MKFPNDWIRFVWPGWLGGLLSACLPLLAGDKIAVLHLTRPKQ